MYPSRLCVQIEPYQPTKDAHGATVDGWGDPVPHMVIGVAPAGGRSGEQSISGNRRPLQADYEAYASCPLGGPRHRWTLPNGSKVEQIGYPDDYGMGPWWDNAGCVSYLRRVEG